MTVKPETLSETFKQMSPATIRKLILEGEAYLAEKAFTGILAVLKTGVGLGLDSVVMCPTDHPEIRIVTTTGSDARADWRSVGKLVTQAGVIMGNEEIPLQVQIANTEDYVTGTCTMIIDAFPPVFRFLYDAEEEHVSVQDALSFLSPRDVSGV